MTYSHGTMKVHCDIREVMVALRRVQREARKTDRAIGRVLDKAKKLKLLKAEASRFPRT